MIILYFDDSIEQSKRKVEKHAKNLKIQEFCLPENIFQSLR